MYTSMYVTHMHIIYLCMLSICLKYHQADWDPECVHVLLPLNLAAICYVIRACAKTCAHTAMSVSEKRLDKPSRKLVSVSEQRLDKLDKPTMQLTEKRRGT